MNALLVFTTKILGAVFTLLLGMVISRYYGVEVLGNFAIVLLIVNISSIISSWGLNVYYLTNIHSRLRYKGLQESGVLYANIIFSIVILPVVMLVSYISLPKVFLWMVPSYIALSFLISKSTILTSKGLYLSNSIFDNIIRTLFPLVFVLIGLFVSTYLLNGRLLLETFSTTYLLSHVLMFLVFLFYISKIFNIWAYIRYMANYIKRHFKSMMVNGYHITVPLLLIILIAQFDRVIILNLSSEEMLGIYVIAQSALNIIDYAMLSVITVITPTISDYIKENKLSQLRQLCKKNAWILFLYSALCVLLALFLGKYFFFLYGVESKEGVMCLVIILIGYAISQLFGFGFTVASYSEHKKNLIKWQLLILVFTIINSLILTYWLGIIGSAIAVSLSSILSKFIPWFYLKKSGLYVGVF